MLYTVISDCFYYNDTIGKYWRKSSAIRAAKEALTHGYPGSIFYRKADSIREVYVRDRKGITICAMKEASE